MEGVITAIVAFLFVGIIFPAIIKHKPQYYAAFALIIISMFLNVLATLMTSLSALLMLTEALLVATSLVLLMLAAGGLSASEFAGNLAGSFEVIRRGETEKELIIPISGQKAPGAKPVVYRDPPGASEPPGRVYTINDPSYKPEPPVDHSSSIPLE